MKWWFEWGDIDNSFEFYFSESQPDKTYGSCYGPYNTLSEAKRELLVRFIGARDELNACIRDVKCVRATNVKGRDKK